MTSTHQLAFAAGEMFFDDWTSITRTLIVGVAAYIALVILLRISGKRTLSKMNAFDLVITVAPLQPSCWIRTFRSPKAWSRWRY